MNRKIIITGASGGIGRALAEQFYREGDRLILCANHHPENLPDLPGAARFAGDLSDPETVRRLFQLVREVFKTPDILINNAGVADFSLFQDSSDENYLRILHANLSSCVRCSKEAVKLMLPEKHGRILNISSVWGTFGASCEAEYSLTKGGINALTRSLAKELAPSGIQVNALSLGAIDTEMNARLTASEKEALEAEIPAGRMGTCEETAEFVSLILRAPDYLNGAVIPFDGAWM